MPALIPGAPALHVELYLGGAAFTLDDPVKGTLDAGNVLGPTGDGWHRTDCRVMGAHWRNGATRPDGILSRMAPGYAQVQTYDPERELDPSNPVGPYRRRIGPFTPLRIVAEMEPLPPADDVRYLEHFTGQADGPYAGQLTPQNNARYAVAGGLLRQTTKGTAGIATIDLGTAWQHVTADLAADVEAKATAGLVLACDPTGNASGIQIIPAPQFATLNVRTRRPGGNWTFRQNLGTPLSCQGPLSATYDPVTGQLEVVPSNGVPVTVDLADLGAFTGTHAGTIDQAAASTAGYRSVRFAAILDATGQTLWPQFTGRVYAAWWEDGQTWIEATDGLADLAAFDQPAGAEVGAGELSGARVRRVLDAAGYSGATQLDVGTEELQATANAQAALTELFLVTDSELGALYVRSDGTLRFRDRTAWTAETEPALTITAQDRCGILTSSQARLSADAVRNIIYAASNGHTQEEAVDALSAAKWGSRRWGRNDLLLRPQAALRRWATEVLAWFANTRPGAVETLVLNPPTQPNLWPATLRLELLDRVQLGFGDLEETPLLVGYAHSVTATAWQVTLVLATTPTTESAQ